MHLARKTWAVSLAIMLILFFFRLMTTSSNRSKTATVHPQPIKVAQPAPSSDDADEPTVTPQTASPTRHPNGLGRMAAALALAVTLVPGAGLVMAGAALADATHLSGDKVDADTIRLNWTGNGAPVDQKCGTDADPGHLGYENGATADNYMLWIFNTDGGGTSGAVTITINGTTYSDSNDGHQIVTPYIDPATIDHDAVNGYDAFTNFVVDSTGNGAWVLTISHGCGVVEDDVIDPQGSIHGPCADPSYYGVFDNSLTTSQTITFRFRWYTTTGLHTKKKDVPAGMTYTTYIHWAMPGTYVYLGYKDPNTGVWTPLDKVLAAHGRYPPCVYQPGWPTPV